MFATRLVQLIEAHADQLAEGVLYEMRNDARCADVIRKVPPQELKTRAYEIYHHLGEWLLNKTNSQIEDRYVGTGVRRARQGVVYSDLYWAVTLTKEYLWEYLEREGLLEEPVELFGEMELLHQLERFFDRALYFMALGYESVQREWEADRAAAKAVGY